MVDNSGGKPQKKGKVLSFTAGLEDYQDGAKESGQGEFLKLPEGESLVKVTGDDVELTENQYGREQYLFRVEVEGNPYIWGISKNSPLARKVLEALTAKKRKLTVVRTGTKQDDTRYSIKSASK